MKNQILIEVYQSKFLVTREEHDGNLVLAEFPRYADAYAAAHLLAREQGLSVEVQPDGMEGGAQ